MVFPDENGQEDTSIIDRRIVLDPENGIGAVCELNTDGLPTYIESLDIKA